MSSETVAVPAFRNVDTTLPRRRSAPTWLPAPVQRTGPQTRRPATAARGWIPTPRQSVGEKLMLAALAGAALAGIGYGFVALLNLVQNWAVFHAGIANLMQ